MLDRDEMFFSGLSYIYVRIKFSKPLDI